MNVALILSGGTGSRMKADKPKQYLRIQGRMLIEYCLETFEKCKDIDAIQIVADECWKESLENLSLCKLKGFSKPSVTRQLSILNGLKDIRSYADDSDIVVIHDAARPLITEKLIEMIIQTVKEHDGAMPVLPMKDTIYYSRDGKGVTSLLDRNCLFAGQAPEAFQLGKYYDANIQLSKEKLLTINGSTEPAVLAGLDIAFVAGEETNFKITTQEDFEQFKELISKGV